MYGGVWVCVRGGACRFSQRLYFHIVQVKGYNFSFIRDVVDIYMYRVHPCDTFVVLLITEAC